MLTDFNWTRTHNHLVRKRTLNHLTKLAILAILAKWLSVYELSGCGLESSYSQLDFAPASSKEILDIQATIKCGFTLKRVSDMTKRYSHLKKEFFFNQLTNWLWWWWWWWWWWWIVFVVWLTDERRLALSPLTNY